MRELRGKTALITGAAKRTGRNIAFELAGRGVNLVVHYNALIRPVRQTAGGLDGLVKNASIFPVETIANTEVNASAPLALSRCFAHEIGRGQIINLHDSRLKGYDWNHRRLYPEQTCTRGHDTDDGAGIRAETFYFDAEFSIIGDDKTEIASVSTRG